MACPPTLHRLGLVRGIVIENGMDREFGRYGSFDIFEEVDELPMGMPGTALAQDLTGLNIEGGKEREGAMAKIVVAAPLGSSRTERQKRLGAQSGQRSGESTPPPRPKCGYCQ
jgi:hypothetical protein